MPALQGEKSPSSPAAAAVAGLLAPHLQNRIGKRNDVLKTASRSEKSGRLFCMHVPE